MPDHRAHTGVYLVTALLALWAWLVNGHPGVLWLGLAIVALGGVLLVAHWRSDPHRVWNFWLEAALAALYLLWLFVGGNVGLYVLLLVLLALVGLVVTGRSLVPTPRRAA